MPGGLSAFSELRLLEWMLSTVSVTRPTAWWMALHNGAPGESGLLNELGAGIGYARQAISFTSPTNGVIYSAAQLTFGPATADWPSVSHFSIFTLANGGNCLLWGQLKTAKLVKNGNPLVFGAGEVKATLS